MDGVYRINALQNTLKRLIDIPLADRPWNVKNETTKKCRELATQIAVDTDAIIGIYPASAAEGNKPPAIGTIEDMLKLIHLISVEVADTYEQVATKAVMLIPGGYRQPFEFLQNAAGEVLELG